jgi:predicted aldo/keto reductase-like oxidoreductase
MWDSAEHKRSPAEWGLQWVWNHPEVSVVLSGMSTMQQVQENVASAERSGAESLTPAELELVARVRSAYRSLRPVPCTGCRYCQPCPNGVAIPNIFEIFNSAVMVNEQDHGRFLYSLLPAADHADNCVECGECEEQCPQQLPIRDWLKKAHAYLSLR